MTVKVLTTVRYWNAATNNVRRLIFLHRSHKLSEIALGYEMAFLITWDPTKSGLFRSDKASISLLTMGNKNCNNLLRTIMEEVFVNVATDFLIHSLLGLVSWASLLQVQTGITPCHAISINHFFKLSAPKSFGEENRVIVIVVLFRRNDTNRNRLGNEDLDLISIGETHQNISACWVIVKWLNQEQGIAFNFSGTRLARLVRRNSHIRFFDR